MPARVPAAQPQSSQTGPSGESADRAIAAAVANSFGCGASSKMTWAFVPLNPKELTPAIRGRSDRGQAIARDGNFDWHLFPGKSAD